MASAKDKLNNHIGSIATACNMKQYAPPTSTTLYQALYRLSTVCDVEMLLTP